jgi:glucan phosphoethanolaminetransferase (alkaline phosphatase superfamily)
MRKIRFVLCTLYATNICKVPLKIRNLTYMQHFRHLLSQLYAYSFEILLLLLLLYLPRVNHVVIGHLIVIGQ